MSNKTKKKLDENFDTEESKEEAKEESEVEEASDNKDKAEAEDTSKEAEDTSQESEEDNEEASEDSKDKKSSKKDKKNKAQEVIDELNDKVMRQMAEFENFRKRSDKEKTQMYDMGAKSILEKILPVVDNFERGLDAAADGDSFADGMKMIYKQLMTSLEEAGVKEIEAEGEEFNPDYHNAVMHVEDEELGENIVVEVLQKGYMYNDTVLRHAMVKVAN